MNQGYEKMEVLYRKANPLSQSKPPIPEKNTRIKLYKKDEVCRKGAMPLPIDIECMEDVEIELRDGVKLYGDVYRKKGDGPVPIILVYTPYSKRGGPFNENFDVTKTGFPKNQVSGLQGFEAPDPAYWCQYGYGICKVDARGIAHSGGDMYFMGHRAGLDVYDTIEWIAEQPWSTGKVCMMGNSQLAMIQWTAAAEQPPHLVAIAPWEGLTDEYRDTICRGGIPDTIFHDVDIMAFLYGQNRFEDITGMLKKYPLMCDYWRDKIAPIEKVTIPAYVVASWTHAIHTRSTIKAFERLGSTEKWLRIHDTHEWPDLDTKENADDLRKFFDRYLKGIENGWENTPKVRYSVLDFNAKENQFRTANQWPAVPVKETEFYLDATNGTLCESTPQNQGTVSYDGTKRGREDGVRFEYKVTKEMELHGPSNLIVYAQTDTGDDMDLYVTFYKVSPKGRVMYHVCFPALQKRFNLMIKLQPKKKQLPGGPIYVGPTGRLRASHRALDPVKSTILEPYLTHEKEEKIEKNSPVKLEIGLWPTGMLLHPGETLVLEISGHIAGPVAAARASDEQPDAVIETVNKGKHTILTGREFNSRLILPVVEK